MMVSPDWGATLAALARLIYLQLGGLKRPLTPRRARLVVLRQKLAGNWLKWDIGDSFGWLDQKEQDAKKSPDCFRTRASMERARHALNRDAQPTDAPGRVRRLSPIGTTRFCGFTENRAMDIG